MRAEVGRVTGLRLLVGGLVVLVVAAAIGWVGVAQDWFGSKEQGRMSYSPYGPSGNATPAYPDPSASSSPMPSPSDGSTPGPRPTHPAKPLAGKVVVIDPGHQLGNHNHLSEIDAPVNAGGFDKPCNTTGTATNAGYPEATFTWDVALDLRRVLRRQGARVLLTRHDNSEDAWGPCVDVRGRAGNPGQPGPTADLRISIHADGSLAAGAHGFHVIAPASPGYDSLGAAGRRRLAARSLALAETMRNRMVAAGFATATYTAHRGIDVRSDLGTLNWSAVPVAMIECGNMRDSGDAALLTSAAGQGRIALALANAVERYLGR